MTWIALLRHGVTGWNARGVIQGRTDIPLSPAGVERLRQTRPGADFLRARWVTSPLARAVQTAAILNPLSEAEIRPELIEANWGEFEGERRDRLPRRIRALGITPNHGLDFTPPAGESARAVRRRLLGWLESIAADPAAVVAVTHKGVIRSALSAACDWDMSADFNREIHWSLPHIFRLDADGKPRLARLNCPWDQPPAEAPD